MAYMIFVAMVLSFTPLKLTRVLSFLSGVLCCRAVMLLMCRFAAIVLGRFDAGVLVCCSGGVM